MLKAVFEFEPPRHQGRAVGGTREAIVRGEAKVFIIAAVPDREIATHVMGRLIL